MGKTFFQFKILKSNLFHLSLILYSISLIVQGQVGPPANMTRIISTDFSNTELSVYDDGNDWNYSIRDGNNASCDIWDNNPNQSGALKIQSEVESVNSPLTDYARASIVDIGGSHNEVMQFSLYQLDNVSAGTRLQLQGSLQRSDIDRVYISFDMFPSSEIRKAYEIYGNGASFVFSEFHANGSSPLYGIRARVRYIDNKVVYHANCKSEGDVVWEAGNPPDGRLEMQFDEWSHIEILCEAETNGLGRYRIWVTNKGNTYLAVDEQNTSVGYPIKSNIHWFKNYPDGDVIDNADTSILVRYDNLEAYASAGTNWPTCSIIPDPSEPPVIFNQSYLVEYDAEANGVYNIGDVEASDPDSDETITYSITGGNASGYYTIEPNTGTLSVNNPDYFNTAPRDDMLTIKVTDDGPLNLSSEAIITVSLSAPQLVETNNPPVIEDQQFVVLENDFLTNYIGTVTASDADTGQKLTFTIVEGNESGLFELDPESGELRVTTEDIFNFEPDSYILYVKVEDDAEEAASDEALIEVLVDKTDPIVYIDPENTNDVLEDGSSEHPFDSWLDITWSEGFSYLQKRGTTANEISKISIYANNVVIGAYGEGENPVIWSASEDYALKAVEKSQIKIENISIVAEKANSSIYFLGDSNNDITLENVKIKGSVYGIYIVGGQNYMIRNNYFQSTNEAIYSYAQLTNVYYNIFENNQYGIHIDGDNSVAKIYNNVFYDNNTSIICSYAELSLQNNIFHMNSITDKGLEFNGTSLITDYNLYYPDQDGLIEYNGDRYDNLAEFRSIGNVEKNSLTENPMFKDEFNHDFSLEIESPAIDAGIDVGITSDFMGRLVPFGDTPDIGAIESNEERSPLVLNETISDDINIFPNPSSEGIIYISAENLPKEEVRIQIRDLHGRSVLQKKFENLGDKFDQVLDISHFPSGIYVLTLKFANSIYIHKISKTF